MAVVVTDNRTVWNEGDDATGWSATATAAATDPVPIEAINRISYVVGAATQDAFFTGTARALHAHIVYAWVFGRIVADSLANGGYGIHIGDGTNRMHYHVAGDDKAAFRHEDGPVGWQCLVVDTANLPTAKTVRAGSEAALLANLSTAITQIGSVCKSLLAAPGMSPTYAVDIIRILDPAVNNGCALTITGGTSSTQGKFSEIAAEDRAITDLKAHGIIRQLGAGVFGVQGPLRFGNPTGTNSSWFQDSDVTLIFETRNFLTTRYKIVIVDNGTGTTTFRLGEKVGSGITATGTKGVSIIAATGVGMEFDAATDTDVTDVFIYGSTFKGTSSGIKLRTGHEFIGCLVEACGQVQANGATMVNTSILSSTVAADSSALLWNVATDPDTLLHGTSYSKGTNAHHAIEFGTSSPLSMVLRSVDFSGFNASHAQNDSTLHVLRTTGTVTISLVGCTGNISYKTAGATVVLVIDPVTTSVTVRDNNNALLADAFVYLQASDGTGDLPYNDSVTITRTDTTATVSHTAHNLATNNYVTIKGAAQPEYNGLKQITVINANSYTFTVSGTPATPATGTIVSTGIVLGSVTTGTGVVSDTRTYSVNQPVSGYVRKSSTSPIFKDAPISGTINNTAGLSINVKMILDE